LKSRLKSSPPQLSKTGRSEAVTPENPRGSTVTHPERHVQAALSRAARHCGGRRRRAGAAAIAAGEGWPPARSAGRGGGAQNAFCSSYTPHNAIIVHNISDEYAWIEHHYPDGMVVMQRVTHRDGKPFDILTLRSANGDEQDVYFDIAAFFRLM